MTMINIYSRFHIMRQKDDEHIYNMGMAPSGPIPDA